MKVVRQRIGLFGGTFNPLHNAHLMIAEDVLEHFGLDKVIFIPACVPPHKGPEKVDGSPEERLEMIRLAIAGRPDFEVSDMEIRRGGISYTVETLRQFSARYPGADLFFIIGGDSLAELHLWRDYCELLRLARFVTVRRPGDGVADLPEMESGLRRQLSEDMIDVRPSDISSTEVRRRVAAGLSVRGLVPEAVAEYIEQNSLYR